MIARGEKSARCALVTAILLLGAVMVLEPIGVFGHFLHDHAGPHSPAGHFDVLRAGGVDAPDGADHHWHHLMFPAEIIEHPVVAALPVLVGPVADAKAERPATAPFLAFCPPRS
jgi:hypothetical protein